MYEPSAKFGHFGLVTGFKFRLGEFDPINFTMGLMVIVLQRPFLVNEVWRAKLGEMNYYLEEMLL